MFYVFELSRIRFRFFFFFKQKTAYEMRISDWSSDVCSSDLVGQIAKIKGCRVVGIAGGAEKCAYLVDELGFDAAIDHRSPRFADELATACPDGVDVYFELVGGAVWQAVLPLLNEFARVPV